MILYLTQGGKYTGETLEQDDKLPIPHNAALTPPPDDTHVFFNGYWIPETDVPVIEIPPPPPVVIPQSIAPRQARLKLLEAGLLDNLEAIITTNRSWQIEWEYATEVKRDSPLIDAVAAQAGLTSEQIDQMFIEASQL